MYRGYIMVCCGPNCELSSGRLADEFEVQIKLAGLRKEIQVIRGGCLGLCGSGPNVIIFPEGTIYSHVKNEDAARIVSEHLLKGGRVEDLLYDENQAAGTVRSLEETDFFQKQTRIALRNCGVIDTILASGLRGRGGAGFPTGLKWKFASGNRGEVQKYVCCNADEGDPGAFMDRSVLEGEESP